MKYQIVIALESYYVTSWFAHALREYVSKTEIEIFLLVMKSGKPDFRKRKGNKILKRIMPFFYPVKLTDYFESVPTASKHPLLAMVSSKSRMALIEDESSPKHIFVHKGHLFTSAGLKGLWYFFLHFFALGRPMVIDDGRFLINSVFFQTRNYTYAKNIGFLRYNFEKILDHILFHVPHNFPSHIENGLSENEFFKFFRYPFWQFTQKFRENLLSPGWQLIKMNRHSLTMLKSVMGGGLIKPTINCGWADPMIVDSQQGLFLFFEEVYNQKGHISVVRLNRDTLDMEGLPSSILKFDTHLSYPFVFEVDGRWYMIPENSANEEVSIYRSVDFPIRWEHYKTVFHGEKWVDTTPFFYRGKWWIFSVKKPAPYASSYQDLHLFFCDDILNDKWIPHPQNPVVSDVRSARPAGALFLYNNKLYRPAQNCINKYGGGLQFCEIITMSEDKYEEKVMGEFTFPWTSNLSSFHTISIYEEMVIGDCFV